MIKEEKNVSPTGGLNKTLPYCQFQNLTVISFHNNLLYNWDSLDEKSDLQHIYNIFLDHEQWSQTVSIYNRNWKPFKYFLFLAEYIVKYLSKTG